MKNFLILTLAIIIMPGCKSSLQNSSHEHTNALVHETSPYLLQHAHNPVDWYPWGEEALEKAANEDKLLIISVGYAACHWCHVMEHESFEDTIVAQLMNEHFVSIKVDREERPDIDDVYMTACHLSNSKGCGWPLNAIALPDGRPIWAGTYFPKKKWMEILGYFHKQKEEDPSKMLEYAENLTHSIKQQGQLPVHITGEETGFSEEILPAIVSNILSKHDPKKGGRTGAPKFPMPDIYQFLLSYAYQTQSEEATNAVNLILDNMAAGGIYDQLGGGFARYSTDSDWFAPHFEKMLYDNAQLISLYAKAFAQSPNDRYKEVIEQSVEFIFRELSYAKGGFFSSLDADSEGEEGRFYVWKKDEINQLLTPEEADVFNTYYQIKGNGNWEHENNILHYDLANLNQLDAQQSEHLKNAKEKLFLARDKRVRPPLDDKVLTAWNGLMITALLDAAAALSNETYKKAALKTANLYLEKAINTDGRLTRSSKNGVYTINAFLDDYALLAQAFVNLYQATFDEKWLSEAQRLVDYALLHFDNDQSDLYFYTSDIDPSLVSRRMEIQDNVIASSNSVLAEVLFDLGTYQNNEEYLDQSQKMIQSVLAQTSIKDNPTFFSNWLQLLLKLTYPVYEVAIVGSQADELRAELQTHYLPYVQYLGGEDEGTLDLLKYKAVEGETFIYVCRNKVCKLPVTSTSEALDLLGF